jgi:hypothetical protein
MGRSPLAPSSVQRRRTTEDYPPLQEILTRGPKFPDLIRFIIFAKNPITFLFSKNTPVSYYFNKTTHCFSVLAN